MHEKKRQVTVSSVETVIQESQKLGEEIQCNGLIPEILEEIQMQVAHKVLRKYRNAFSELAN